MLSSQPTDNMFRGQIFIHGGQNLPFVMCKRVPYTGKHDSNKIIVIFKMLYCQELRD